MNYSFHSSNGMYSSHSTFLTDFKLVYAASKKKKKRNVEVGTVQKNIKEQNRAQKKKEESI